MSTDDTLTARQKRAIAALVSEPTVKAAADKAGISRKTLYRYLADDAFRAELSQAQSNVLRMSTLRLAGLLQKALDVIALDMLPGVDGKIRLRAATAVLRHITGLLEYADLEQRVSELERKVQNGQH